MSKTVTTAGVTKTTYYIRDAQGNALAVYERKGSSLIWKEQDLYGSSRLGMAKPEREMTGFFWQSASYTLVTGARSYELSNHLGNVLAVISDRGELQSAQDYFPFGMAMPGRSSGAYRYGFNGKETDPETGLNDFGARLYDNRLGRWLAVDPKAESYPSHSPYNFCLNTPVLLMDPDGQDPIITITDKIIGWAEQKIYRTEGMPKNNAPYYIINVPLYEAIVTDDEDQNFNMRFMVTRDAWVFDKLDENGNLLLDNIAFEPSKSGSNEYTAEYIDVYPHHNNTAAFELRQNGSKLLNSEPRKNSDGKMAATASSVMIHVSGIYYNEEEKNTRHSSSLACFGIVNEGNSFKSPADAEANRVISGIRQQADKDALIGYSDIKIIINPRKNVQKTQTVTPCD